jgi:hypothetical protein
VQDGSFSVPCQRNARAFPSSPCLRIGYWCCEHCLIFVKLGGWTIYVGTPSLPVTSNWPTNVNILRISQLNDFGYISLFGLRSFWFHRYTEKIWRKYPCNSHWTSKKMNASFPVGKRIITRNIKLVIIFLAFNIGLYNDTIHFCCLHVPTTNNNLIYRNKKVCSSYCYGVQLGQGTLSTSQFMTFRIFL